MPESDLLTSAETARLLRLNVKRIQRLARTGALPGVRVGRKWLFSRAALDDLLGESGGEANRPLEISARNRLRGVVTSVTVDGVMAEVRLRIGDQELVSIITRASAERLRLERGDRVTAVIKATEVMIGLV